jgi:hypothetical protein
MGDVMKGSNAKAKWGPLGVKMAVAAALVAIGTIGGAYGDDALVGIQARDSVCREVVASLRAESTSYATKADVATIEARLDAVDYTLDQIMIEIRGIRAKLWDDRDDVEQ